MAPFKRTLSLQTTIAIVIGGIIGSGIFMKPALMAAQLGNPLLLLSVWVVAGLITLFGALSNSELAAMFPETGGQYVFFQKIYGEGFAFVYGWAAFAVFNTGGNASVAYICAHYMNYFLELPRLPLAIEQEWVWQLPYIGKLFPLENLGEKGLTMGIIGLLSWVSYRSVRYGGTLQRMFTWIKIIAILLLILGIFSSGKGNLAEAFHSVNWEPSGWAMVAAYTAALAGAFWAFDGWNNLTFVAGEVKDPQVTIPKSLLIGIIACILIYFLINLAFLYIMPIEQLAASAFVASDVAVKAWGVLGGSLIALLVMVSTFGSANANILATARVTYAMGAESKWFQSAAKLHPKFQTPGNAIWLNACWAFALILTGSFDMLTDMLIFVSWFFYGMSALGVFILRHRLPNAKRIYRAWGYPWVPLVFLLFTFCFLVLTLYKDIHQYVTGAAPLINAVLGTLITLMGIPIYYFTKKK